MMRQTSMYKSRPTERGQSAFSGQQHYWLKWQPLRKKLEFPDVYDRVELTQRVFVSWTILLAKMFRVPPRVSLPRQSTETQATGELECWPQCKGSRPVSRCIHSSVNERCRCRKNGCRFVDGDVETAYRRPPGVPSASSRSFWTTINVRPSVRSACDSGKNGRLSGRHRAKRLTVAQSGVCGRVTACLCLCVWYWTLILQHTCWIQIDAVNKRPYILWRCCYELKPCFKLFAKICSFNHSQ